MKQKSFCNFNIFIISKSRKYKISKNQKGKVDSHLNLNLQSLIMKSNFNILSLSKSIEYFQTSLNTNLQPKLFQQHLTTLQHLLSSSNQNEGASLNIILSILPSLTQRYYQLSTSKNELIKEEYLFVKFVKIISGITRMCLGNQSNYRKDIIVILMSGTVTLTKNYFERTDVQFTDFKLVLLQFNLQLLQNITLRKDFKIQEIYPKEYSLCTILIKKKNLPLRHFNYCIKIIQILVKNNRKIALDGQNDKFASQCCKRLVQDIKFITSIFPSLELPFQQSLKQLASTLLQIQLENSRPNLNDLLVQRAQQEIVIQNSRKELFIYTVLLAQICKIDIELNKFDFYRQQIIIECYKTLFVNTCGSILNITADLSLKKRQISKLNYLAKIVEFSSQQDSACLKAIDLLLHMFRIKQSHQLITIPHHSTTIPLDQIQSYHNIVNYPVKGIIKEYQTELFRMMVEVIPFYELQPSVLGLVQELLHQMNPKNGEILIKYFSDQLLKYEYNLNMSVTKLYSHLQILFVIRFLLNIDCAQFSPLLLSQIFLTLGQKTETLRSLQASYVEEELLIAITLEIVYKCFQHLATTYKEEGSIKSRIKQTQNSITLVQKILNQLSEESYLIRLITTHTLLAYTNNQSISISLKPIQATLLLRNKNNLPLMVNLLKIAILNSDDYEELAEFYMQYRGAQTVLRLLLPKIKIQTARRCILTVERWWLLLNREVIEYLNEKQMSNKEGQSFPMSNGENVSIRNALGVVIIEMEEKWMFYLKSQKRELIIDILIMLLKANPKMVFFRSKFSKFLTIFYSILQETLGLVQIVHQSCKEKNKTIVKILQPQKVEFYSRLRLKIYKLFNLIPQQCWQLYSKQRTEPLTSLLMNEFQSVKKEYLFEGRLQHKVVYDQLKRLILTLQTF